jgi:glycosyltransferase involved in cell wall biosynthesis
VHILFLTENFPPEVNAAATRVYERAVYWIRQGHSVTVLTCFPNFPRGRLYPGYRQKLWQRETLDGINIIRLPTYIARNEGFVRRTLDFVSFMIVAVVAALFVRRPTVVAATSPQFFTAVAGWMVGALRRKPFVFELGDLWPASIVAVGALRNGRILRALERFELYLYRKAAVVIALTNAFKANLVSRGVPPEKVVVVINGVDLSRYAPQAPSNSLLAEWSLAGKFVLGYVGTHGMAHQLENAVAAAALLDGKSKVHFLFVGDGACKAELQSQARRGNLTNVTFAPPRPKEQMPDVWSVCDVALVHLKDDPTFGEVIPSKMFEAMGMGKPLLLVAPPGEAKAILDASGAGEWVPAAKPALLAQQVDSLSNDPQRVADLAAASLASAARYSRERQASDVLAAFKLAIERYARVAAPAFEADVDQGA